MKINGSSSKFIKSLGKTNCPICQSKFIKPWQSHSDFLVMDFDNSCQCSIAGSLNYHVQYQWQEQNSNIVPKSLVKSETIYFQYNKCTYTVATFYHVKKIGNHLSFYYPGIKELKLFSIEGNLFDFNNFNAKKFADKINLIMTFN